MLLPRARVRAEAVVDRLPNGDFLVTVQGLLPHAYKRVYTIRADSDNVAAFEGIGRFVKEAEGIDDGRARASKSAISII